MKRLNESYEMYTEVIETLDEVIDAIDLMNPHKISAAQLHDMKQYAKFYSNAVAALEERYDALHRSMYAQN